MSHEVFLVGRSNQVGTEGGDNFRRSVKNDTLDGLEGDDTLQRGIGTDLLTGVERLWFADRQVAADFGAADHEISTTRIHPAGLQQDGLDHV